MAVPFPLLCERMFLLRSIVNSSLRVLCLHIGPSKIERDQVADYAWRKGWDLAAAERWLAPILNYEPARAAAA